MSYDEEKRRPRQPSPTVNLQPEERVRRQPRDPDEREALTRMSHIASDKLEILEPRKWRLHLGREKIVEYLKQQYKP